MTNRNRLMLALLVCLALPLLNACSDTRPLGERINGTWWCAEENAMFVFNLKNHAGTVTYVKDRDDGDNLVTTFDIESVKYTDNGSVSWLVSESQCVDEGFSFCFRLFSEIKVNGDKLTMYYYNKGWDSLEIRRFDMKRVSKDTDI